MGKRNKSYFYHTTKEYDPSMFFGEILNTFKNNFIPAQSKILLKILKKPGIGYHYYFHIRDTYHTPFDHWYVMHNNIWLEYILGWIKKGLRQNGPKDQN